MLLIVVQRRASLLSLVDSSSQGAMADWREAKGGEESPAGLRLMTMTIYEH